MRLWLSLLLLQRLLQATGDAGSAQEEEEKRLNDEINHLEEDWTSLSASLCSSSAEGSLIPKLWNPLETDGNILEAPWPAADMEAGSGPSADQPAFKSQLYLDSGEGPVRTREQVHEQELRVLQQFQGWYQQCQLDGGRRPPTPAFFSLYPKLQKLRAHQNMGSLLQESQGAGQQECSAFSQQLQQLGITSHLQQCTSCFTDKYKQSLLGTYDPGLSKQMFMDEWGLEKWDGVNFILNSPEVVQPVEMDLSRLGLSKKATKKATKGIGQVGLKNSIDFNHDTSRYEMWYHSEDDSTKSANYILLDSEDGLSWGNARPVNFPTNSKGKQSNSELCVTRDMHEPNPQMRYKAVHQCSGTLQTCMSSSADGVSFSPMNGGKPIHQVEGGEHSDTMSCLVWDPNSNMYRMTNRKAYPTVRSWRDIRGVRHLQTPDTSQPDKWQQVLEYKLDRQYGELEHFRQVAYGFSQSYYNGIWIGLFQLFNWPISTNISNRWTAQDNSHYNCNRQYRNIFVGTSRDGVHFDLGWLYANQPLISRRGQPWCEIIQSNKFLTENGNMSFVFSTRPRPHGYKDAAPANKVYKAQWQLDRLIGLKAPQSGEVNTKAFAFPGSSSQLILDLKTTAKPAQGQAHEACVQLEVVDATSNAVVEPFSLSRSDKICNTDGSAVHASWGGSQDTSALQGMHVRLRFRMGSGSELYGFQIVDGQPTTQMAPPTEPAHAATAPIETEKPTIARSMKPVDFVID